MMPSIPKVSGAVANSNESKAIAGGVINARELGVPGSAHASATLAHASSVGRAINTPRGIVRTLGILAIGPLGPAAAGFVTAGPVGGCIGLFFGTVATAAAVFPCSPNNTVKASEAKVLDNLNNNSLDVLSTLRERVTDPIEDKNVVDAARKVADHLPSQPTVPSRYLVPPPAHNHQTTLNSGHTSAGRSVYRFILAANPTQVSLHTQAHGDIKDLIVDMNTPPETMRQAAQIAAAFFSSPGTTPTPAKTATPSAALLANNRVGTLLAAPEVKRTRPIPAAKRAAPPQPEMSELEYVFAAREAKKAWANLAVSGGFRPG